MRVLLATDGSASAGVAADLVAGIEWPAGTAIRIVEAIETGAALFGGPWLAVAIDDAERLEAELRREAEQAVEQARGRLSRPGLEVVGEVLRGRPATTTISDAKDFDANLIVVGSRGHGTIESMLLGSVSAEIVDLAPIPVLIARSQTIKRVVLAWDGSVAARVAADLLTSWPVFRGSSVRVVSVADIEVPWWTGFPETGTPQALPLYLEAAAASRRTHDGLAKEMTEELGAVGIDAVADPHEGDAATQIIAAAQAGNADLIVLGTHGRTGLARLVLGSVARNVLQHATCSVLVAPHPEHRS